MLNRNWKYKDICHLKLDSISLHDISINAKKCHIAVYADVVLLLIRWQGVLGDLRVSITSQTEMVELAHLTGDRQGDLKDERRRSQMAAARQVLERSTVMLLTSSKACLRHPDCPSARENRDTVFCQMRRAMDLIHYVVKDGVLSASEGSRRPPGASSSSSSPSPTPSPLFLAPTAEHRLLLQHGRRASEEEDWETGRTAHIAIRQLEDLSSTVRLTEDGIPGGVRGGVGTRERLKAALDAVVERTQDFTDSAYTSHEHREGILLLCDRARLQLNALMHEAEETIGVPQLDAATGALLQVTSDLRALLRRAALERASDLLAEMGDPTSGNGVVADMVSALRNVAQAGDSRRIDEVSERFAEYVDHVVEVVKLLRHVAPTDSLQVYAKHSEIGIRTYGPQVVTAAQSLSRHPTSKIAKENLEGIHRNMSMTLLKLFHGSVYYSRLLQSEVRVKILYQDYWM
ncbi:hypothetical protein J437_LFUL002744 [Ladona fulva]|uniref:Vinculin n=1 Tax=Ladona fulva TaxID=123851 RepID=A0A8K0K2V7_LADFU|nr:hypothetical protein J437_LFUL002744 [Ladona fulva]